MRPWFWDFVRAARLCSVHGLFVGVAVVTASLASSTDAGAVGTRTFVLDTLDKLSGGDLKGVAVSSDGTVRVGFTLGNTPIPEANASFSALALADGTALIG